MWRFCPGLVGIWSCFCWSAIALAQDSGPGPAEGAMAKQYDVTLLRVGSMSQGIFSFYADELESTAPNPSGTPARNGADPNNTGSTPSTRGNSATTTTGNSATNAELNASISTAAVTMGGFQSDVGVTTRIGRWYALDLGSFSLWHATADNTNGTVILTGYATPNMIAGRAFGQTIVRNGRGRGLRAIFRTTFFFGTAGDGNQPLPADSGPDDPTSPDPTSESTAAAN